MTHTHIDWPGKSGRTYRYFFVHSPTIEGIKALAGNYAFVRQLPNGKYRAVYFGQARNLQERIPGHERWNDAVRAGASHVMAHATQGGEQARCEEETDLIQYWRPVLNVQHRTQTQGG